MNDKDAKGKIILILSFVVILFSVIVILFAGLDPFLLWVFAGVPFIVIISLSIIAVLERLEIDISRREWLFQDISLIAWMLGLIFISGFKNGLSIRVATLFALLIFTAAGMALHYAQYMHMNNLLGAKEAKLIIVASVIAVLWGISLFWVPSSRWVIIDWPCREAEWRYEDAKARLKESLNTWDSSKTDFLERQAWSALIELEACRGGSGATKKSRRSLEELKR